MFLSKKRRKDTSLLLLLPVLALIFCVSFAKPGISKENEKYASFVMNADTGEVYRARYADKSLYPASLTKIMTLMMAFEALDRGDIKMNDRIHVSKYAASMEPSKFYLKPGSTITVEDAIYGLVTKSANDVAVALGEHIGGSESQFGELMTRRAREIGMKSTRYTNASGLPDSRQKTTARDQARLAQYILQRYPHHYKVFATRSFKYNGNTYRNHNRLLGSYKGLDGFKTGYINASGFNLVASAYQDGQRLIGVVFGGRSGATRNAHMVEILDEGFSKARKGSRVAIINVPKPAHKPQTLKMAAIYKEPVNDDIVETVAVTNNQPTPTTDTVALEKVLSSYAQPIGLKAQAATAATPTNQAVAATVPAEWDESAPENMRMLEIASTNPSAGAMPAPLPHPKQVVGKWAIQIGAFNNRVSVDKALQQAMDKLPQAYRKASPVSVPLETEKGTVYRARLANLSQREAFQACNYFPECMPVAPSSVRINYVP